jgi:DNA-3-methyladenine glycosylase II
MNGSIADTKEWNAGIRHLKKSDKVMARLVNRLGVKRRTLKKNHFEALVTAIIFQQISGRAGDSIFKKFKALYGGKTPTPKIFLSTKEKAVRGAGISPQKYSYLMDLSERIEDGRLELKKFHSMDDAAVVEELDEVRGIGRWTAKMFLMFTLGRTDVLPVDDLGLKKGLMKAYKLKSMPTEQKFRKLAEKWHPYCTIASLHLWKILDNEGAGDNW